MHESNRPRGFEDRLLSELKTYVSERTPTMSETEETPARTPRFGRATKFSLAGAVGAVALGVGAIVALPALTASPAYAVEQQQDGNIRIEIRGPEDAQGLEDTLAEHGIEAEVEFTPQGEACSDGWYTPVETPNPDGTSNEIGTDDEGRPFVGIEVDPADYPIGGDRTLMIEVTESLFADQPASPVDDKAGMLSFAVGTAQGDIGECDPQPIEQHGEEPADGDKGTDAEKGTSDKKNDDGSKDKN